MISDLFNKKTSEKPIVAYSADETVTKRDFMEKRSLVLIGAICGDIIGSWYEFCSTKWLDFELFTNRSRFTDDTVCSIAIADALMNDKDFIGKLKHWCRKYPKAGYGGNFNWWFRQDDPQPYNSWGNGSAMRVSAVGAYATSIEEVLELAQESAEVSHNHPEGIKGAQATALAIYLALKGFTKKEIKEQIESRLGYDLSRKYSDIQRYYTFDVSCQGSVPEAIIAFLESSDYESAVRMAVAYGGDADTQAAITGGIAAAYYGEIPDYILIECFKRLPLDIKEVILNFNNVVMDKDNTIEQMMLGCLYGQAIGDSLGLGSEFMSKDEVDKNYPAGLSHYNQIIQDAHRRGWHKGAWTDDTDMMLCILSAFEDGGFNIQQIAQNFKDWADGDPKDIGAHTFKVLAMRDYVEKYDHCSRLWWELSQKSSAANGALMRTSVVGLANNNIEKQSVDICKLTHYDPRCIGSCVIASLIIHNLVWNNYEMTYDEIKSIAKDYDDRIIEWIELAYQNDDISALDLDEPHSIGYTLRTLSASLWCYWHADSFESGLLAVVNEGGDADTNAAIACAILGAKFGYGSIPHYYIENLHNGEEYRSIVNKFISSVLNENE